MAERRHHQRNSIVFPATLGVAGSTQTAPGECRDLSLGGLYLVTALRPMVGAQIVLTATLPGSTDPVALLVSVRWIGPDGIGVQFGSVDARERAAIAGALHLAVPTNAAPPARRTSVVAIAVAAGLVLSLGTGFAVARWGPMLLNRSPAQAAASTGAPPPRRPVTTPVVASAPPGPPAVVSAPRAPTAMAPPDSAVVAPPVSVAVSAAIAPPVSAAIAPPVSAAVSADVAPPVSAAVSGPAPSTRPGPPPPTGNPSACMATMFPPNTFKEPPDLAFVCEEQDARLIANRLRVRVVVGSGGKLTDGANEWARLGWYELAVTAILRRSCCGQPSPFVLPDAPAACESLPPLLDRLGDAVRARSGVEDAVKAFEQAAACLHASRNGAYRYPSGPFSGSQVAFAAFLSRNPD